MFVEFGVEERRSGSPIGIPYFGSRKKISNVFCLSKKKVTCKDSLNLDAKKIFKRT